MNHPPKTPPGPGTSAPDDGSDRLLHRLHDGEVTPAERAAALAHLDDDARLKLAALDDLGGSLRALYRGQSADFDAWPAVEREVAKGKVVPFRRRLLRAPVWISTLAVAAAAVAVVLLLPGSPGHPSNEAQIDDLEVSGASATILSIPDDSHGGSTTVLWLEE